MIKRTNEVHKLETEQLQGSIGRQIDRIIEDLLQTKEMVIRGNNPSYRYPINDISDLTKRIGELSIMLEFRGLFPENGSDKEEQQTNKILPVITDLTRF
jgi:hypothetical protein